MNTESNIQEIIKRFERVAEQASSIDVGSALLAGVNDAKAQMEVRIFNEGKDKAGQSLGKYVGKKSKFTNQTKNKKLKKHIGSDLTSYEKKRVTKGRQIGYKDLEFSGSLRRAIITANDGKDKAVCTINNEFEAKIAQYQEEQIGRLRVRDRVPIFGVNQQEIDSCIQTTNGVLKQIYDGLFKSQ